MQQLTCHICMLLTCINVKVSSPALLVTEPLCDKSLLANVSLRSPQLNIVQLLLGVEIQPRGSPKQAVKNNKNKNKRTMLESMHVTKLELYIDEYQTKIIQSISIHSKTLKSHHWYKCKKTAYFP